MFHKIGTIKYFAHVLTLPPRRAVTARPICCAVALVCEPTPVVELQEHEREREENVERLTLDPLLFLLAAAAGASAATLTTVVERRRGNKRGGE